MFCSDHSFSNGTRRFSKKSTSMADFIVTFGYKFPYDLRLTNRNNQYGPN